MAEKLMLVKGMTCPSCEQRIVDALVQTGARDVRADARRGEVVLDPARATERPLRDAVERLGYRASTFQSLPAEPVAPRPSGSGEWTPLLLLLPAVWCGGPLLLAAAVAVGFGSWFAANRLLVVSALALTAALIFVATWLHGRRGQLR